MKEYKDNVILRFCVDVFRVWKREFRNVFHNMGALVFFLLLPTMYPIVYALIYNPELIRDVPFVVVDEDRSPESRAFARDFDASQYAYLKGYAANMEEAKVAMHKKEAYAILYFPKDFGKSLGRSEQAHVSLYCDMSILMRYKGFLLTMTNITSERGAKLMTQSVNNISSSYLPLVENPVQLVPVMIGNPEQGFATFLIPGILIMVLQQSIILGITMLFGTEKEHRRANNGYDSAQITTGVLPSMLGKALCYYSIYIIPTIYALKYVPIFFSFPQSSDMILIFVFVLPFLFASIFMGMVIQALVTEREAGFLVVVFTSIIFIFLSGLTWPRYAMNPFLYLFGDCVPATWAIDGFVRMSSNGATLEQVSHSYGVLWLLCFAYFTVAYLILRFINIRNKRKQQIALTKDVEA